MPKKTKRLVDEVHEREDYRFEKFGWPRAVVQAMLSAQQMKRKKGELGFREKALVFDEDSVFLEADPVPRVLLVQNFVVSGMTSADYFNGGGCGSADHFSKVTLTLTLTLILTLTPTLTLSVTLTLVTNPMTSSRARVARVEGD